MSIIMEHVPYIPFAGPLLQWPVARTETGLLAAFALLGGLTLIYALPDIRRGFLWAALIHVVGGILSLVAADLIMLLLGWELMTFSAFFIFTRERDADSLNSGLRYIVMHMGAAVLFFVGAAWQWQAAGSLAVTKVAPGAQLFFLGAILIKTAVMPLHFWLVDAYPRAGFAGSVLLAAYATKVGIFTAARLLNYLPGGVPVLSYIGALVAVAGAFAALRQCQARKLLAYHIVSQLGYMLAGVGLASASGAAAGLFHALNNVIYKSLLLMVAGVVCRQYGHEDLRRMGGAARRMPLTFCACLLAAAAIAGLPPMAGYASKELLKQALTPSLNLLLWLASLGNADPGGSLCVERSLARTACAGSTSLCPGGAVGRPVADPGGFVVVAGGAQTPGATGCPGRCHFSDGGDRDFQDGGPAAALASLA
ncbi:MAG: hypothetical protein LC725_09420 [Lentisphaerae bacterium]|nr:hypothetical protein [Lentisphaerota bacterium]